MTVCGAAKDDVMREQGKQRLQECDYGWASGGRMTGRRSVVSGDVTSRIDRE